MNLRLRKEKTFKIFIAVLQLNIYSGALIIHRTKEYDIADKYGNYCFLNSMVVEQKCKCNSDNPILYSLESAQTVCEKERTLRESAGVQFTRYQTVTTSSIDTSPCDWKKLNYIKIWNFNEETGTGFWKDYSDRQFFKFAFKKSDNTLEINDRSKWNGLLILFNFKCVKDHRQIIARFTGSCQYPLPDSLTDITGLNHLKENEINPARSPSDHETTVENTNTQLHPKHKKANSQATNQKGVIIGISLGIFALIVATILILLFRRKRKKRQELKKETSKPLCSENEVIYATPSTKKAKQEKMHLVQITGTAVQHEYRIIEKDEDQVENNYSKISPTEYQEPDNVTLNNINCSYDTYISADHENHNYIPINNNKTLDEQVTMNISDEEKSSGSKSENDYYSTAPSHTSSKPQCEYAQVNKNRDDESKYNGRKNQESSDYYSTAICVKPVEKPITDEYAQVIKN